MGWNTVRFLAHHPVFDGIPRTPPSTSCTPTIPRPSDPALVAAGDRVRHRVRRRASPRDNLVAFQFHLEKSGPVGLKLLCNFLAWDGRWEASACLRSASSSASTCGRQDDEGRQVPGQRGRRGPRGDGARLLRGGRRRAGVLRHHRLRGTAADPHRHGAPGGRAIFIPFSVGGGISTVEEMREVLLAGAEKVSVNSSAVRDPEIIADGAATVRQAVRRAGHGRPAGPRHALRVRGGDRRRQDAHRPGRARVGAQGGAARRRGNRAQLHRRGRHEGRATSSPLTRMISGAVEIPVVASGGAGKPEHLVAVLTEGGADAALVASMVHFGDVQDRRDQGAPGTATACPFGADRAASPWAVVRKPELLYILRRTENRIPWKEQASMPTYEYECTKCGHTFEAFQSIMDEPLSRCPECKSAVRRVINGGLGVIFKGSGFYSTDNKNGSALTGGNGGSTGTRTRRREAFGGRPDIARGEDGNCEKVRLLSPGSRPLSGEPRHRPPESRRSGLPPPRRSVPSSASTSSSSTSSGARRKASSSRRRGG